MISNKIRVTHFGFTTFFLILINIPTPAFAIDDRNAVIVTATRTARTIDDSLASVTVINRKDIERNQSQTVPELLTGVLGIDISTSGGLGKTTDIFVRGANQGHLLVLIDGVKIGSATLGITSLELIPIEQIDRIEIVRGPRSSLYGSEAIGGVIHIFTRKGNKKQKTFFKAGSGSHNTNRASAGIYGKSGKTEYSVSASSIRTDGIDARQPVTGLDEPDKDGYRNNALTIRLGHKFSNTSGLDLSVFRSEGETEFDGNFQNRSEFELRATSLTYSFSPTTNWKSRLLFGDSKDVLDSFKDKTFSSTFITDRIQYSWQNDLTLSDKVLLTLGADYQEDRVSGTTTYNVDERDSKAVFGQYQINAGNHDINISLRSENNDQFGNNKTGNIAWGYKLKQGRRLYASYGTAFKAPTFNQLYFPGFGNPSLKPEDSKTLEIGISSKKSKVRWDLRVFHSIIDNLIASVLVTPPFTFTAENVNKARISGIETGLSTTLAKWNLAVDLTLIDPEDANTDKVLRRRSQQTLKIDLYRKFGKSRFGMTWLAQGHRFEDAANTNRIPGYGIVNLRLQHRLAKRWIIQGRIDNVFDKEYQTADTFNTLGRSYYLTLAYQKQK